jgi:hypothetical protein
MSAAPEARRAVLVWVRGEPPSALILYDPPPGTRRERNVLAWHELDREERAFPLAALAKLHPAPNGKGRAG